MVFKIVFTTNRSLRREFWVLRKFFYWRALRCIRKYWKIYLVKRHLRKLYKPKRQGVQINTTWQNQKQVPIPTTPIPIGIAHQVIFSFSFFFCLFWPGLKSHELGPVLHCLLILFFNVMLSSYCFILLSSFVTYFVFFFFFDYGS